MAPALDTWFFGQVCIVAGEHWSKTYTGLAAQYFQPMCFGGSGMGSFVDLVHVAYVSSWIDYIFPKGVPFNGIRPIGAKSIIDMYPIFKCLNMKEKLATGNIQLTGTNRSKIAELIDSFTLYSFNNVPENLFSVIEFKKSSEILFDSYPEIRRACFENIVGYNAINGTNCQINPAVNISLVTREFLDQTIFPLSQHTKHVDCPKEKRENLYFQHNAIKHATAYKSNQSSSVPLNNSDTKFAYEKIRSTALWILVGRGNLKDTDEENLPPSWILDTATVGENTVVCKRKPKLEHLLMCHVTAQGMELRMQEGDAI